MPLLPVLGTALIALAAATQCDVDEKSRSDCGTSTTNQGQCESSGCCWKAATTPGAPWCFHPADQCSVPSGSKKDCGQKGTTQSQCEQSGCCWKSSSTPGEPWCFQKAGGPSPSPPTPPTPPLPGGVMKGIGYAPVPMKQQGTIPHDDFFCEASKPLWGAGPGYRDDLKIMAGLGANFVRTYGNDQRYGHTEFLQYAKTLGISAFIGFSDYPYDQMPGSCVQQGNNCYSVIKDVYKTMLQGLIVPGTKQYHPAVKYIALANEPDQKWKGAAYKMMISAFDAVLDAEKELGVVAFEGQAAPQFTATVTFGGYGNSCGAYGNVPGLGQMANLQCAMKNPTRFGYKPNNNIGDLYESRFINSFNTQNTPTDSGALWNFITGYKTYFGYDSGASATGKIPVFIGEYHRLASDGGHVEKDVRDIMSMAADPTNPLIGINFFEYQVRYDKGWTRERQFGLFDLGDTAIGQVPLENNGNWQNFTVYCLKTVWDASSNEVMSEAIRKSYGGPGVDPSLLCAQADATEKASAAIVV